MWAYIVRRLLQTLIVIIALSMLIFGLMQLMPGDPIEMMIASNPKFTSEDAARLRELGGYNDPFLERYGKWFWNMVWHWDLGYSSQYRIPVTELLGPRLLNTFYLSISAFLFSVIVAIPLGIYAALRQGSAMDYTVNFIAFTGISVPSFFLGIILIIIFAVWLGWFPAGGTHSQGVPLVGFAVFTDRLSYIFLPMLSLTAQQMAVFARHMRSSMMETMRNDFIRTARAKGLAKKKVIWFHGLRNALLPVVTIVALSFSSIFSGAIITETLFVMANDYFVAMAAFMITVSMVLFMNLVADILYAMLDPRISYS